MTNTISHHANVQATPPENSSSLFEASSSTSVLGHLAVPPQRQEAAGVVARRSVLTDTLTALMRESCSSSSLSRSSIEFSGSVRAKANWAKALDVVRPLIKGAFPGNLVIGRDYWIEALDSRHEYATAQSDLFQHWETKGYKQNPSYFQYLESRRQSASFTGEVISVQQFTPAQSEKLFKVSIRGDQVSFSPDYRADWKEKISHSYESELIFVVDKEGSIYAGFKETGVFHHSSFLSGAPVAMAGTLTIHSTGQLIGMSNASGHYQPALSQCAKFFSQLKAQNVNLSALDFAMYSEGGQGLSTVDVMSAKFWLDIYNRNHGS